MTRNKVTRIQISEQLNPNFEYLENTQKKEQPLRFPRMFWNKVWNYIVVYTAGTPGLSFTKSRSFHNRGLHWYPEILLRITHATNFYSTLIKSTLKLKPTHEGEVKNMFCAWKWWNLYLECEFNYIVISYNLQYT